MKREEEIIKKFKKETGCTLEYSYGNKNNRSGGNIWKFPK